MCNNTKIKIVVLGEYRMVYDSKVSNNIVSIPFKWTIDAWMFNPFKIFHCVSQIIFDASF